MIWTIGTYVADLILFLLVSLDDEYWTDSSRRWNATFFMAVAVVMGTAAAAVLGALRCSGAALVSPPNQAQMKSILNLLCCCCAGAGKMSDSDELDSSSGGGSSSSSNSSSGSCSGTGASPAENPVFPVASGSFKGDARGDGHQLSSSTRPVLGPEARGVSSSSWLSNAAATEAAIAAAATIRKQDVTDFRRVSIIMLVASLGEGFILSTQTSVWSATVHGLSLWKNPQTGTHILSYWNQFFAQTANLVYYIGFLIAIHYICVLCVLSPLRKVTLALVPACIGLVVAAVIEYFRQLTPLVFPDGGGDLGNGTLGSTDAGVADISGSAVPWLPTSDYNGGCDTSRQREMSMAWALVPLALFSLACRF